MEDVLDRLLFDDDPSAQKRAEMRECLGENPELADAWLHWQKARTHVRDQLEDCVADRRLLVLYVLDQKDQHEAMTPPEREAISDTRDDIAKALEDLSALEDVVERIREECDDFDSVWSTHADDLEKVSDRTASRQGAGSQNASARVDRPARHPESRSESKSQRWAPRLALAAIVVGIAVATVLLWPGSSTTTVTVADGSMQSIPLSDGSTVRIVGEASLTYPETFEEGDARRVTLEMGRAFFDVQRRPEGPSFVVQTPTATASVLGTQFGVRAGPDTTEVVLASGSVQVGATDDAEDVGVVLEPGQKSWVAKGEGPSSPTQADLTTELEWTGLFVFRSMPLASVVDLLSRQYDVQVRVDETLAEERITGTFDREQPVQQILDALATTLASEVERENGQYRIVSAR